MRCATHKLGAQPTLRPSNTSFSQSTTFAAHRTIKSMQALALFLASPSHLIDFIAFLRLAICLALTCRWSSQPFTAPLRMPPSLDFPPALAQPDGKYDLDFNNPNSDPTEWISRVKLDLPSLFGSCRVRSRAGCETPSVPRLPRRPISLSLDCLQICLALLYGFEYPRL